MSSVDDALRQARRRIAAGEARQLLAHTLDKPPVWLVAHGEDPLGENAAARFAELVARRAAGEPIAYLTGTREFYGRAFAVGPEVLIPRPETELLVECGLALVADLESPRILDLGSGSGCIAITLALELPRASVTAVELAAATLALAQRNAASHGAAVRFVRSDWFASLGEQRFHLIVSNPPYVAEGDRHLEQGDLRFEPRLALASGADGLAAIRAIVHEARAHLLPGGALLIEHGYDQAEAVGALLAAAGYGEIEHRRDLAGILRVSGAKVP